MKYLHIHRHVTQYKDEVISSCRFVTINDLDNDIIASLATLMPPTPCKQTCTYTHIGVTDGSCHMQDTILHASCHNTQMHFHLYQ